MATKRSSLMAAVEPPPLSPPPTATATATEAAGTKWARATTRVGKRSIAVWVEPGTLRAVKRVSAATDKTVQQLMIEAINALLASYGEHRLE